MDNIKKAKVIIAYCIFYFCVVIFGTAVNIAANRYSNQQFGHFLSNFIFEFRDLIVFMIIALFLVAIKILKNKKPLISDNVIDLLIVVVIFWMLLSMIGQLVNIFNDIALANQNNVNYRPNAYSKGNIAILCLNFVATVLFAIFVKFHKIVGNYFKVFKTKNTNTKSTKNITNEVENNENKDDAVSSDKKKGDADEIN